MNRVLSSAVLSGFLAASLSADTFDWKKTLELPLSPGAVAILVEHGTEPEVQERWRSALKAPEPDIRAAAARAIYAAGARALVPALREALDAETDTASGRELIRALVALGTAEHDTAIVAAARRVPALRVPAWIHLGRARGTGALVHLAAARESDSPAEDRRSLVLAGMRGGRSGLDEAAAAALRDNDVAVWSVVWEAVLSGGPIADAPLVASMTAVEPRVRAITYWSLALLVGHGAKAPKAIEQALASSPEATVDPKSAPASPAEHESRVAFDLLKRARGGKRREDLEWARALPDKSAGSSPFPGPLTGMARLLTKDERKVLIGKGHLRPDIETRLDRDLWRPVAFGSNSLGLDAVSIREFPRGYASGLASLTGCQDEAKYMVGLVEYGPEGRPRTVTVRNTDALTEGCARLARILLASRPFSLYSEPVHVRPSAPEPKAQYTRLPLLDAETLAWDGRRPGDAAGGVVGGVVGGVAGDEPPGPIRVAGNIKDPKKLKHVNPRYPASARSKRVQGIVILETTIDATGRVGDVRVLRGIEELNEAAVDAVRQWEFTPTLLNGQPVPVIYTVTVNFALH